MKINNETKKAYVIHTNTAKTKYLVCKVLNEFETLEEANDVLVDLLTNNKARKKY